MFYFNFYSFISGRAGSRGCAALSPVAAGRGPLEPWDAGPSLRWPLLLKGVGSRLGRLPQSPSRLQGRAQWWHTGLGSVAHGTFPDQGSGLSSALAGGLFTTEPPGIPTLCALKK